MKPKVASILKHIIDSLFVIAMTVIVVLVVWMFAESYIEKSIKFLSEVAPLLLIISFLLISALLGWIFPREMRASVRSIRLWPKHWGLAIRGLIGAITTIVLAKLFRLLEVEYEQVIAIGLLIVIVESLVLLVGWGTAKLHLWFHESSRNNARNHQTGDEPIHRLKDNLFPEYEITAKRILDRLELDKDPDLKGPNIAIVGPYGSGKTSLCNIVEDICQAEKLRFCRFEAWQFLTADAAVRGLLDEIIRTVQGLVDCSGVGSLPDKYIDALRACPNGWLGMIGAFLSKRLSTEDVIWVLQDVLLRIDKRIIVFVDDFDRLESNSREMQDAVAAALNQLQNLTNVQYVLCVGPMRDGAGTDLLKLTRFQELVPEVNGKDVLERLKGLRNEMVRGDENLYCPWDLDKNDPLQYYLHREQLNTTLVSQLTNLIKTPRELKAVELKTKKMWSDGLQGEIAWCDLLLMNTLKISEPGVFEWLMREPEMVMEEQIRIGEPTEEEKAETRNEIEEKLKTLLRTKTKTRMELVQQMLLNLFPNFMKGLGGLAQEMPRIDPQPWEQRICSTPRSGTSYFKRYFSGEVPQEEVSDQPTLQYIRDIAKNGFDPKEFQERYLESHQKLTNDLNRFVSLSGLLTEELAREVCDCILEWMCYREHWNIWQPPEDYVRDVMHDVKEIIESAGTFESMQSRKTGNFESRDEDKLQQWAEDCLGKLIKQDLIVAIMFTSVLSKVILLEKEITPLLGKKVKDIFLNNKEVIWEKAKGYHSYLCWIIKTLDYNKDYESLKGEITKSIVKRAEVDKSEEFATSVIFTLVEGAYPAGRPDIVEGWTFSVNKTENLKTYDMDIMLPLIAGWKDRKFKDPVSAKAYEFLLKEYAEDLKKMDENSLVKKIVDRLKKQGYCQVEGYNKFDYIRETNEAIILLRQKGTEAHIPYSKIAKAIDVVQKDPAIYDKGPSALREHITAHIHSPLWSLLHLLTLNEITEIVESRFPPSRE